VACLQTPEKFRNIPKYSKKIQKITINEEIGGIFIARGCVVGLASVIS
jgi:hypothetical protein